MAKNFLPLRRKYLDKLRALLYQKQAIVSAILECVTAKSFALAAKNMVKPCISYSKSGSLYEIQK